MDDGALPDDFPSEIVHGTTLGRSFRTRRVPTKMLWGPGCQIYHSFPEWIGLYIHLDRKIIGKSKNPTSQQLLRKQMDVSQQIQRPK